MATDKPKQFILEITVFICGALVMVYEIIGSRLLAPYIGTSVYVWTSLIGVILAALSLGYWLGGKTADRQPELKILASMIFLAGGVIGITLIFKDVVLSFVAASNLILELKAVLAAFLLFAPASVLLGFVTPYTVKLKMKTLDDAGKTVGRLYALSTVGSILGTFAAGFFLIPFVGSTRSLYLIGATLFIVSLLLAPFALTKTNVSLLVFFVFGITATESVKYYLTAKQNLHEFDTEYNHVRIFDYLENDRQMRGLMIDPRATQSKMFLDSDDLASEYAKFYHLVRCFKPDFQRVLMIGGAGYSFPKDFLKTYPAARIDVVEIDPQMTEIAKVYFDFKENPRLESIHQDGRIFLNQAESEKYDAVLLDAFGSLFSVPFQLTTVEAVKEIRRVLKPGGVVIFNLGGAVSGKSSRFFRAELSTYREIFTSVAVFKVNPENSDEKVQNLIVVAGKNVGEPSNSTFDDQLSNLLKRRISPDALVNSLSIPVLTDDLAPVEYYNSFIQNDY